MRFCYYWRMQNIHPPLTSLSDLTADSWKKSGLVDPFFCDAPEAATWCAYVTEIIEAAKKTGATEISYLGGGHEARAYQLFRNGNPMWVVLRVHRNGEMHSQAEGSLPFYSDEIISLVEPEQNSQKRSARDDYPGSIRITIMPKIIQEEPMWDEYGNILDGTTEEDLDRLEYIQGANNAMLKSQGYRGLDNHPGNVGYYKLNNEKYLPIVFDPGPKMEDEGTMFLVSSNERELRDVVEAREQIKNHPWTDADWQELRQEVGADAARLFSGKSTAYSVRMNSKKQNLPADEVTGIPTSSVKAVTLREGQCLLPRQHWAGASGRAQSGL
jgi:hypothetical protein